jgi:hypothetical protein
MVEAVPVPITVKMRIGWDASTINAPELARALEDVGAAAVTVHGRTRCQKYEGAADWAQIARVKEAVDVPVFGSGDVEDVETLARRIESGMVDGVVIARGMLGNFWFVRQAVHRLATGTILPDLDFPERVALARRHLDMLCAYHGEPRALRIGRKYVAWTIRGCAGAARLRAEVQTMDTRERLDALLDRALAVARARPEKKKGASGNQRRPERGGSNRDPRRDLAADHMNQSQFRQGITTSCYAALYVARLYSGLRRAEVTGYSAIFALPRELNGQTCIADARRSREA